MTKSEFIKTVSDKTGYTKREIATILKTMGETITDALVENQTVSFVGFGSFFTRERSARNGINPRTREKIQIPARRAPDFKFGTNIKRAIIAHDSAANNTKSKGKKKKK